jgi:inner membrane protein
MASEFSHAVVAAALVQVHGRTSLPQRALSLSILCAILPDADVLGFAFGIEYGGFFGHRGFTHSLCFALALSTVIVQVGFNEVSGFSRSWWVLVTHFFLVTASPRFLGCDDQRGTRRGLLCPVR